ncbi:hypothetical protein K504DRAFT_489159 [Pleomassaria siparia CBS 279.74]|uniref:Uncharacterized protein n=1 Tax=Pleomassaria siparia CBS 279.74 TaxID=1314801 RepID=A0A6G1KJ06_9PLEO|nr:hypothetical protein K504DRAFT_489159 [Pleomassaria siparia CBS 279.74]
MSKRKRRPDVVLDQLSYVKRRKADPHRFCNIHPELVRIWLEPDSGEVLLSSLFAAFCEELLKWKLRSIAENAQELPDPDPLPRSTASTEQAVPPVKSCVVPGSEGSNGSSVPPVERGTVFEGVSTLIDTATTSTTPVVAQETVPDVPARSAGIGTVRSDVSMLGKSEQDRIGARNVESTVAIPPLPRSTSQLPVAGCSALCESTNIPIRAAASAKHQRTALTIVLGHSREPDTIACHAASKEDFHKHWGAEASLPQGRSTVHVVLNPGLHALSCEHGSNEKVAHAHDFDPVRRRSTGRCYYARHGHIDSYCDRQ